MNLSSFVNAVNKPVVPVRSFMTIIFRDVKIIHLPGALVIGQISPLDQVMHISILIETTEKTTNVINKKGRAQDFYTSVIKRKPCQPPLGTC